MGEFEEQNEKKIREEFEATGKQSQKKIILTEQTDAIEQDQKEQDLFNEVADVVKNKLNDHGVYIIMGNYVGQNEGIIAGENARFKNTDFTRSRRRNISDIKNGKSHKTDTLFDDESKICKWMKNNFGNENFLWLISLSVFHDMPYSWIKRNAEVLENKRCFEVEDKIAAGKIITKDELLKSIGAFIYMDVVNSNSGKVECEFVGFVSENAAERILKCLWMQLCDYREGILEWLQLFAYQAQWPQSYAAVVAISFVAQLDYYYFETHMLQKLVSDEYTDVLAEIMHLISRNEKYRDGINKIAKHWGTLSKCSYLLTALSIAQKNRWNELEIEPIMSKYISRTIIAVQKTWLEDYSQNFPVMFIIGQRRADYYKAMIEAVYAQSYLGASKYRKVQTEDVDQIFLMMVETDYEYTKTTREDMLLVNMLFVPNKYAPKVTDLWRRLWKKHAIHTQVKDMMISYWKQKCNWKPEYEKLMEQFFEKIGTSEREQRMIYRRVRGENEIWIQ